MVLQHPPPRLLLTVASGTLILFVTVTSFVWFYLTHTLTPYPFIDEELHVPAAQRYCQGNLSYWDNKITTPAGLYLHALGMQTLLSATRYTSSSMDGVPLLSPSIVLNDTAPVTLDGKNVPYFCTLVWLRLWSYLSWLGCIIMLMAILQVYRSGPRSSSYSFGIPIVLTSLAISTYSPLWLTSGFVYTDTSSILYIVITKYCFHCSTVYDTPNPATTKNNPSKKDDGTTGTILTRPSYRCLVLGVITSLCSMLYRQTNLLWYTYILMEDMVPSIVYRYERYSRLSIIKTASPTPTSTVTSILSLATYTLRYYVILLIPHLIGIYYLLWNNGSIVLGDRSAHTPVFHYTQFMYNVCIIGTYLLLEYGGIMIIQGINAFYPGSPNRIPLLPTQNEYVSTLHWFCGGTTHSTVLSKNGKHNSIPRSFSSSFMSRRVILFLIFVVYLLNIYGIASYTYIHPYLLADNRHYSFFLVQKIIVPYRHYLPFILGTFATLCEILVFTRLSILSSSVWTHRVSTLIKDDDSSLISRFPLANVLYYGSYLYQPCIWCIFSMITVIPAYLFEFRYFIPSVTLGLLYIWGNECILYSNRTVSLDGKGHEETDSESVVEDTPSPINQEKASRNTGRKIHLRRRFASDALQDNVSGSNGMNGSLLSSSLDSKDSSSIASSDIVSYPVSLYLGPFLSLLLNWTITVLIMYIFYKYPFTWPDGKYIMRRIW